jgi:hypothetical protein
MKVKITRMKKKFRENGSTEVPVLVKHNEDGEWALSIMKELRWIFIGRLMISWFTKKPEIPVINEELLLPR